MEITDKEFLRKIANRVKQLRKQKGLTQFELSIDSVDIRIIQRIEAGKTNFQIYTLHKVAKKLDISLSEFFSEGFE